MLREIFVARIESSPVYERIGMLAYHMEVDGKSSIADLCYDVSDMKSLKENLRNLMKHKKRRNIKITNDIPREVSDGFVTKDYKFKPLSDDELLELVSSSGLEQLIKVK